MFARAPVEEKRDIGQQTRPSQYVQKAALARKPGTTALGPWLSDGPAAKMLLSMATPRP